MMRGISTMVAVFVLASGSLLAQQNSAARPSVLTAPVVSEGCPIHLSAQRRATVTFNVARMPQKSHGQELELMFSRMNAPKIEKISVTVHGWSSGSRMAPAEMNSKDDAVETFELVRPADALSLLESRIATRKMSFIRWVELNSIDYANGSSWHATKDSQCRATPERFQLVASR